MTMRSRVAAARVGHIATSSARDEPHVVPVCFALEEEVIYWAVDAKSKRSRNLKRLDNLLENPRAALLVDHYEDDWSAIWWIRVDCSARVLKDSATVQRALQALQRKYAQYAEKPPEGPFVAMSIQRWSGWEAEPAATD